MATIQMQEIGTADASVKTYILTTSKKSSQESDPSTRLDLIRPSSNTHKRSMTTSSMQSFISTRIAPLFLPTGYPHSVTPDYTPYQIYDSLQAFTSSITGLLSSRAVLQSLGMNSESSASTATYATLLGIARSTIGNLSTILFADYMSSRISGEVKFYRFLADILNDAGFLLEMLSPSMPDYLKVPSLCLSSALRAMCGVAGGSSKAILSAHFALDGNLGELNAKDGSQETLVNLIGMWIGGVVVSKVESLWATWCWMIVLVSLHLWFNWCAVKSVRPRNLNLRRAGVVLSMLIKYGKCDSVESVGARERVFEKPDVIRDESDQVLLTGRMGVSIGDLMRCMGSKKQGGSGSEFMQGNMMQKLLDVFEKEQYLLWYNMDCRESAVALKEGASRDDQLRAWCHALRVFHHIHGRDPSGCQPLQVISETMTINNDAWQEFRGRIEDAGWNIGATMLESTPGIRVRLLHAS